MHLTKLIQYLLLLSVLSGCTFSPPESDLINNREELAAEDVAWLSYPLPDLPDYLTLDEMVEIATERNLELYVQEQQWAIQNERTNRELWALIPQLNYNSNYTRRNRNTASTSQLLVPPAAGSPLIPYEIGIPKHEHNWNLTFLWNILDFGVTYFRAGQERDRTIIQSYEYDRIRQNVILRVVQAYWRAVAAKQAMDRAAVLLPEMLSQTKKLNRELADRVYLTKDQGLEKLVFFYQREIELKGFNDRPDSSDPTQGYDKEYDNAILDLSQLMQLPPFTHFDVVMPDDLPFEVELPDPEELFKIALVNRPELYEQDLTAKIASDDIFAAVVEALPGVNLFFSQNHDSNRFLFFKNWYQAGMNVAWNLFAVPVHYSEAMIGAEEKELARRQRLLQSEAILIQVSLAYLLFQQNQEQYLLAKQWADASTKVAELARKESRVGKKSRLEALQSEIDAALSLNNASKIYAELQNNLEQLNNAIGIPLYFQTEYLGKLTLEQIDDQK